MVSRSTERRRRLGLTQVGIDTSDEMWREVMEATGATTKTVAVDRALHSALKLARYANENDLTLPGSWSTTSARPTK